MKQLSIVMAIKLLLLVAIWQIFLKPYVVSVDSHAMTNLISGNTDQIQQKVKKWLMQK